MLERNICRKTNGNEFQSNNVAKHNKRMYWIDVEDGARAIAVMGEITDEKNRK